MSDLKPDLHLIKPISRTMPFIRIEVHCLLSPEDPRWKEMNSVALEIGYPGRRGDTLWKHIGWIQQTSPAANKQFAHALWSRDNSQQILEFDFLPAYQENTHAINLTYCIKKQVFQANGRTKHLKPKILKGNFQDDIFSLKFEAKP
jgi:hypothetical protein